ncbi:hypothetical protein B0H16DRAFT_1609011 [Mycena metata]|uniref:Uncharacterized protein n=1 Tax=Mycena metata TaxID=1033252 RepID=A0AAD7HEX4_9AGAR|nr:hypothetical protein B0H16DRAFT_1609011 [Mycena metata]
MSTPASSLLSGAEDWPTFRVSAQSQLRREGMFTLLEIVIQADSATTALAAAAIITSSLRPSAPAAATGTSTTSSSTTTVVAPPAVAFKDTPAERNSRALGIINKFLSLELCMEYVDESSAATLWAKLRERSEEDNRTDTAMGVLSNLFSTKLAIESNPELIDRIKIATHIGIVKGYFDRLARLKYPLPADIQPLTLLSTFPDDPYWAGIKGNIVSSLGTGITWDKARARLLTIGKRPEPADESALAAKALGSHKAKPAGNKLCAFHGQNNTYI